MKSIIATALGLSILLASCGNTNLASPNTKNEPVSTASVQAYQNPTRVMRLSSSNAHELLSINRDEYTVRFKGSGIYVASLRVGDIMVSQPVEDVAPNGLCLKVTEISELGGWSATVSTTAVGWNEMKQFQRQLKPYPVCSQGGM